MLWSHFLAGLLWIPKGGHIKPVNDEKGSGMTLSHRGLFKKGLGVSKQWHVLRVK